MRSYMMQVDRKQPLPIGAPVAQLDRAPDYGSGGLGFDSLRVYHNYQQLTSATSIILGVFSLKWY